MIARRTVLATRGAALVLEPSFEGNGEPMFAVYGGDGGFLESFASADAKQAYRLGFSAYRSQVAAFNVYDTTGQWPWGESWRGRGGK